MNDFTVRKLLAAALFGAGIVGVRTCANFEIWDAGIMLPWNGCPVFGSMIVVVMLDRLPLNSVGFGTLPRKGWPCVVLSSSYPPNTKNLFLITGPPPVAPHWVRRYGGFCAAKKLRASSLSFRRYSYNDPWNSLVPDLVTTEMAACPCPYSVENELRSTLNSCTVSTE